MPSSRDPKLREKGEETQLSKVFKEFKGVNTQSDRTAIPEDTFFRLDNLIPIGHSNIHTVQDFSAVGAGAIVGTPYWQQYANLNGTDYCYVFCTNGNVYQIGCSPTVPQTYTLITSALSGAGSRMDQWNGGATNTAPVILFIDSTGLYSWDGTTFTHITGGGTPSAGTEIAVYAGRVWVFNNRLMTTSAVGGYDNTSWGTGSVITYLTDPQLRGSVMRSISCNGYLYIFGKSSINVVSDVYVPSGATTPVFTNTNIEPLIGSDQPGSVFATSRDVYFANRYGAHRIQGTTVQRISKDIDGTWQYLDFTVPIFGGMAVVQNILCAGFMVKQKADPFYGTRLAIWMFFDNKWWASVPKFFPTATTMCWGMAGGRVAMFTASANAVINDVFGWSDYNGNNLYGSSPQSAWATALWSLGDPITIKDVYQAGVEISNSFGTSIATMSINIDTELSSSTFTAPPASAGITWVNASGQVVSWTNNAAQTVTWVGAQWALFSADGTGGYGHYIGVSASAPANSAYQLNSAMFDYEFRNRWTS